MARKDWRNQGGVTDPATGAVTYSTVRVKNPKTTGRVGDEQHPILLGPPVKQPKPPKPAPTWGGVGSPPPGSGGQTPSTGTVKIRRPKHPGATYKQRHHGGR